MKAEEITSVDKCVGCALCESVCPKQCIEMRMSAEGFAYPYIDESNCIDCKACQKRCPVNNVVTNSAGEFGQRAELAVCKDADVYKRSSSGGIFYYLANRVIELGGCVFGAAWDRNFKLHHICAETAEDVNRLLGSKYIQSSTSGIWKRVKAEVATGRTVLFSGTPCQIGALRSYFPTVPDNLIIVEVICMGVPSPGMFYDYVSEISKKIGSPIGEIRFRDKTHFGTVRSQSLIIRSNCGTAYARTRNTDPFFLQFLHCNTLRRSCYDCAFKSQVRAADLTLGDCWGMSEQAVAELGTPIASLVIMNTSKGQAMIEAIEKNINTSAVEMTSVWRCQRMLTQSCTPGPMRDTIFENMPSETQGGLYRYLQKAGGLTWKDALKAKIVHFRYGVKNERKH